jgi:hypothetical protein
MPGNRGEPRPHRALIPTHNLEQRVVAMVARHPKRTLMTLTEPYVRTQVAGQAEGTVSALSNCLGMMIAGSGSNR